jgi:hypothetical protein
MNEQESKECLRQVSGVESPLSDDDLLWCKETARKIMEARASGVIVTCDRFIVDVDVEFGKQAEAELPNVPLAERGFGS